MEDENEDEWEDEIEEGVEGGRARGGWTAELARLGFWLFLVASYLLWRCLVLFFFSCLRALHKLFLPHGTPYVQRVFARVTSACCTRRSGPPHSYHPPAPIDRIPWGSLPRIGLEGAGRPFASLSLEQTASLYRNRFTIQLYSTLSVPTDSSL